MAAALSKNGLMKTQRDHHSLHYFWKRSIKYSIPEPVAGPKNTSNQLHQNKQFSRFTQSIFRKTKEMDFPTVSSHFSSRASSSSQKSGLAGWYLVMLKTRPVATKSITASLIYTAADISSQTIVGETMEQYDLMRTLRMAGYGLLILGPSVHYWYNFMSRVFPKRDLSSTFKKMALGQAAYGPAMTVIFLSVNAALQGESGSEIVARLKRDLLSTMINGIMYWPLCDFVTFKFVPVHLQEKSSSPTTKEELGRATWTFLHTLAAQYPDKPTRQQKKDAKELMTILTRMYPCKECADHFKEVIRANPVQAGSHHEFSQWLCHVHNVVNRSLGKLVFPCERVDARWGKLECEQRACDLHGTSMDFSNELK